MRRWMIAKGGPRFPSQAVAHDVRRTRFLDQWTRRSIRMSNSFRIGVTRDFLKPDGTLGFGDIGLELLDQISARVFPAFVRAELEREDQKEIAGEKEEVFEEGEVHAGEVQDRLDDP